MKRFFKILLKILLGLLVFLLLAGGIIYYRSVNYKMYELGLDRQAFPGLQTESDVPIVARRLISDMTLEEKIDQLYGEKMSSIPKMAVNFLLEKRFPHFYVGRNERLNIPPWVLSDGPRGARVMDKDVFGVTTFPVAMARGASWDTDLERRIHEVIAIEMRANKTNYAATPCLNLLRHPAWGRAQETYGEDPFLLGEFGVAAVRGIEAHNVMACPKHFALNSLDNSRLFVDVEVDERTLREVYLPHFKKTIQVGKPASIMSAYNKVNGEYCANNRHLLTDILRDDWGFQGFVTSDWFYGTRDGIGSIKAGLNAEMPVQKHYDDDVLEQGIERGDITEEDLDDLVFESLSTRLKYLIAEDPMEYSKELIACEAHTALAREAAEKGMVLVKNQGVLPLDSESGKAVLVLGRLADMENTGDHASSDATSAYVVTPYEGIRWHNEELGNQVELYSGEDLELTREKASEADEVILVVGYTFEDEGEYMILEGSMKESSEAGKLVGDPGIGGDRSSLRLTEEDEKLIQAVATSNENMVVVYVGGSAIDMGPWEDRIPAILFSWYSGMEGGNALANILYGKVNPSGKLPFTIARNEKDYPFFNPYTMKIRYDYYHGYSLFEKQGLEVAYPFGHGLSYTNYEYADLEVDTTGLTTDSHITVRARVSNTGKVRGEEVVQVYIGFENSNIDRPVKLLKGFDKIELDAGESKKVEIDVDVADLAWYDPDEKAWKTEKMVYQVFIGPSSASEDLLEASFEIR
jgi:beta-glucosidase